MPETRIQNQHLLWRAAFGPMAENTAGLDSISNNGLWKLLLKTSSKKPVKIIVADNLVDGLYNGVSELSALDKAGKEEKMKQRKQMRQQSREELKGLNLLWLHEMINSGAQLREKISLFWHGHFACRVINSFFQQEILHTIRYNALGNFGDLLRDVSKSPAMLQFLNNQQNRKSHPNENFAREVMELFTMGRGNYTENDIKEAARAFTGWGFNLHGEFVFRKFQHDNGQKTFLGRTGNFDGDDILNIILEQKQTAKFIATKFYKFFVNDNVNDEHISTLATRFYNSSYNIETLLTDIFTSSWFYDEKNIGIKIKSPIELIAGIRRILPLQLDDPNSQLLYQKVLGQILFYPPNVAGWPGGRSWIDSSSLLMRMQIPQVIASNEELDIKAKSDDDVNMGMMEARTEVIRKNLYRQAGGGANIDWKLILKAFEKVPRGNLLQEIAASLLQSPSRSSVRAVGKFLETQTREQYIKTAVVRLMSLPEYQLC